MLYTQTRPKLGFLSQWDPDRVAPASLASGLNLSFWEPFGVSWAVPKSAFIPNFSVFILNRASVLCSALCSKPGVLALNFRHWLILFFFYFYFFISALVNSYTLNYDVSILARELLTGFLNTHMYADNIHNGFMLFYSYCFINQIFSSYDTICGHFPITL